MPYKADVEMGLSGLKLDKRRKYHLALHYILQHWGKALPERLLWKVRENKTGWQVSTLAQNTTLIHCSGITPEQIVKVGGLDPSLSTEVCIPTESGKVLGDWLWHEFVFGFLFDAQGSLDPKAANLLGFASGGYIYQLTLPAGTPYMCQEGKIVKNQEVGFPELIPKACITPYLYKDGNITPLHF